MQRKDWTIVSRYFLSDQGWQRDTKTIHGTLTDAHYAASVVATELDQRFGDDHFWTVNIYAEGRTDSAAELFHGRLI